MESLALADRKIPRKDLATGIGASFLIHILLFSSAFIFAWIMPHKPLMPPYCTVNLVSNKDIGMGVAEPKGSPKAPEDAAPSETEKTTGKKAGKSESVAPIKRLAVDDAVKRPEVQIKKIEPKETPPEPVKSQGLDAIEKNLDKLASKPKAVPHNSSPAPSEQVSHQARNQPAAQPPAPAVQPRSQAGTDNPGRGTPNGASEAGNQGATHGSTTGSPEGSTAMNQLANIYGLQVIQKIQNQWRLVEEEGVNGLRTVVEVQIKTTGEVIGIKLREKSGNDRFDEAAVRAVEKAAPLPPVPEAIAQHNTTLILKFKPGQVS